MIDFNKEYTFNVDKKKFYFPWLTLIIFTFCPVILYFLNNPKELVYLNYFPKLVVGFLITPTLFILVYSLMFFSVKKFRYLSKKISSLHISSQRIILKSDELVIGNVPIKVIKQAISDNQRIPYAYNESLFSPKTGNVFVSLKSENNIQHQWPLELRTSSELIIPGIFYKNEGKSVVEVLNYFLKHSRH